MAKNKVKYNLKNVHAAKLTVGEQGAFTYAAPQAIPGAVSISLDAEGDTSPFYADGIVYFRSNTNNGYSGDLEIALIPEWFRTDILLEEFADANPEMIGTVTVGKIPLVLIRGADKDGEFVYADTMTNGYAIEFEFYVTDDEGDQQLPITDEHIVQIETILASFEPAA